MDRLKLITPAASAPVSLDLIKAQVSIDGSAFDALLTQYSAAAAALIEEMCGRSFGAQTWELWIDGFADEIALPRGPVTQLVSVKYDDLDGAEQVVDEAIYVLDLVNDPQRIVRASGAAWPQTIVRPNAVRVRFVTGYETLPAPLAQAVMMTVASWFENREAGVLPQVVLNMVEPYRAGWFAA